MSLYKISLYKGPKRVAWKLSFIPVAIMCPETHIYSGSGTSSPLIGPFHLENELCRLRKSNPSIYASARPSRILHPRKSNIRLYLQRIVNRRWEFTVVSTSSIKPGARIVRSPIETWLEEPRRSSYIPLEIGPT